MQSVAIIVSDLMFQSRIEAAVRAAGMTPVVAMTSDEAKRAIEEQPELAVVDLHASGIDVSSAIRTAKAAGLPVLAFGRHTDAAALRAAREAGADRVVARSQLVEELEELIASLVSAEDQSGVSRGTGGQV